MKDFDNKTKRLMKKFGKLDYPHQYWLVEQFLRKNAKQEGNYFIALIKFYQEESNKNA